MRKSQRDANCGLQCKDKMRAAQGCHGLRSTSGRIRQRSAISHGDGDKASCRVTGIEEVAELHNMHGLR